MSKLASLLAFELLIDDLNNHNDWHMTTRGAEVMCNSRNKVTIWMDNIPILDTNTHEPQKLNIGLIRKFKLYKAARRALDRNIEVALKGTK